MRRAFSKEGATALVARLHLEHTKDVDIQYHSLMFLWHMMYQEGCELEICSQLGVVKTSIETLRRFKEEGNFKGIWMRTIWPRNDKSLDKTAHRPEVAV